MPDPSYLSRPGYFPPPPPSVTEDRPIAKWVWVVGAVVLLVVGLSIPFAYELRSMGSEAHAFVDPLHAEMRKGDAEAIFRNADPEWQKIGLPETRHLFGFVHDKLGDPVSSMLVGTNVSVDKDGEKREWTFSSQFAKGAATEMVTVRKTAAGYRLWNYNVQSTLIQRGEYKSLDSGPVKAEP